MDQQEALLRQRDRATLLIMPYDRSGALVYTDKTRVTDLSYGIICVILRLAVLIQYRSVTDRQTDTHTHTQTDSQTDTRRRHIPHLA